MSYDVQTRQAVHYDATKYHIATTCHMILGVREYAAAAEGNEERIVQKEW